MMNIQKLEHLLAFFSRTIKKIAFDDCVFILGYHSVVDFNATREEIPEVFENSIEESNTYVVAFEIKKESISWHGYLQTFIIKEAVYEDIAKYKFYVNDNLLMSLRLDKQEYLRMKLAEA